MVSNPTLFEVITVAEPDELRELAELIASIADIPRDRRGDLIREVLAAQNSGERFKS